MAYKKKVITDGYETIYNNKCFHDYLRLVYEYSKDKKYGYTEVHHIVPTSMGGGDEFNNLVRLTFAEHCHVHWVLKNALAKVNKSKGYYKMVKAFGCMISNRKNPVKMPKNLKPTLNNTIMLIKEHV